MSALAGKLANLGTPPTGGTPCRTCTFLATLDEEDRAELRRRLAETGEGRLGARQLSEFLEPVDGPSSTSIEAHRRKRHE